MGCRVEVIGVICLKQAVVQTHAPSVVQLMLEHAHLIELLLFVGYDVVMD